MARTAYSTLNHGSRRKSKTEPYQAGVLGRGVSLTKKIEKKGCQMNMSAGARSDVKRCRLGESIGLENEFTCKRKT